VDTTTAMLANAFVYLDEHPPSGTGSRDLSWYAWRPKSSCAGSHRSACSPEQRRVTSSSGATDPGGRPDLVSFSAANRDADVFEEPDNRYPRPFPEQTRRFRNWNSPLSGLKSRARSFQNVLQEVLRRMPDYEIDWCTLRNTRRCLSSTDGLPFPRGLHRE